MKKGLRLTFVFPAASLLFWITTLVVSMGWITADATLPDNEPITKGLIYFYTIPSDIIWYVFSYVKLSCLLYFKNYKYVV